MYKCKNSLSSSSLMFTMGRRDVGGFADLVKMISTSRIGSSVVVADHLTKRTTFDDLLETYSTESWVRSRALGGGGSTGIHNLGHPGIPA